MKQLNTQPNEQNNQNSINVPKFVKPTTKKRYYKTLGASGINMYLPLKGHLHLFLSNFRTFLVFWVCVIVHTTYIMILSRFKGKVNNYIHYVFIPDGYNCPIVFNLCIMIPLPVKYDLESAATT